MIIVFISSLVTSFTQPLEYVRYNDVSDALISTFVVTILLFVQYEENDTQYPGWARFVGSLLVISALLPIPIILIVRLILKKDERDNAVKWFVEFPKRCIAVWNDFKQFCINSRSSFKEKSFGQRIRGVCSKCVYRRAWSPTASPYIDMNNEDGQDL